MPYLRNVVLSGLGMAFKLLVLGRPVLQGVPQHSPEGDGLHCIIDIVRKKNFHECRHFLYDEMEYEEDVS